MAGGVGMKYKLSIVFLFLCFTSRAFIYEVCVLRKSASDNNQIQHVICLSDYHDRSLPENAQQRSGVLKKIGCCKPDDTKIIVEDLSSRNGNGSCGCSCFSLNSNTGLLASMAQECQKRGFDVENVEYRYCRVIALGPVLHNLNADPQSITTAQHIRVADVLGEINQAVKDVKAQQCEKLALFVQQQTNHVVNELTHLDLFNYKADSMGYYLSKRTWPTNRLSILKKLLVCDTGLLDLKIVNAVLRAHDKKQVIVLAGGTHINHATQLLKQMGYEVTYKTDIQFFKESDLTKCYAGSDIVNNSYCIKPKAVSLDIIDQFLNQ